MIGVFDSGKGGLLLLKELRKMQPSLDICFFADTKNAPYGTKGEGELVRLVCNDISSLISAGAEKVLMACCTASTVHHLLPSRYQKKSIPIISPVAEAAALATKNGKIGVIATDRTVKSEAFKKELSKYESVESVFQLRAQNLVTLVENGITDENLPGGYNDFIHRLLRPMKEAKIDTLILGCTHFPRLELAIGNSLPGVQLISSAKEGAKELLKHTSRYGKGQTLYL